MSKTVKESQSIISIHAPTRGATYKPPLTNPVNGISIHAPTRGATVPFFYLVSYFLLFQSTLLQEERHWQHSLLFRRINFNPRSYKRSDTTLLLDNSSLIISIHAPTRGATECVHTRTKCHHISIHAPTRGATVPPLNHHLLYQRFQSTLLQEERPCTGRICLDNRLFQSTLLQEERQYSWSD